jgi:16S rRNA processing protein RimM
MPQEKGSDPPYLIVARVVSPQGNRGEVKAELITDFPDRFESTTAVYVGSDHRRFELEGYRVLERVVVLKLRGVESIDQAEQLRGELIEIPQEDAVTLPSGHYFWHQIIGLRVVTAEGEELGSLDDILETGSNDVYVVHGPRGESLIPAIKEVVKSIDLETATMTVHLLPWVD